MIYYKDREVNLLEKIEIYRCLNRKGYVFSIRQNGLVVGHTNSLIMKDCEFIINEKGRSRCVLNKCRNVHAYIRGYIGDISNIKTSFSFILKYNPYNDKKFHTNYGEIDKCDVVYIQDNKILCQ